MGATVIATMAIGVAAATAVYSVVEAVVLRALPVRDPGRLVWMWNGRVERDRAPFSALDLADYREQNTVLDGLAPFINWTANLTGAGDAERLEGVRVDPEFFHQPPSPFLIIPHGTLGMRGASSPGMTLRLATRTLLRRPALTMTILATLAIGLGFNVAAGSIGGSLLRRPYPYPDLDELVIVRDSRPREGLHQRHPIAAGDFLDLRRLAAAFSGMAGWCPAPVVVTGAGTGEPEAIQAIEATANFFDVLGAQAVLGRTFLDGSRSASAEWDAPNRTRRSTPRSSTRRASRAISPSPIRRAIEAAASS
jgi:hypothetical protein